LSGCGGEDASGEEPVAIIVWSDVFADEIRFNCERRQAEDAQHDAEDAKTFGGHTERIRERERVLSEMFVAA
jgi:hypothetical protein